MRATLMLVTAVVLVASTPDTFTNSKTGKVIKGTLIATTVMDGDVVLIVRDASGRLRRLDAAMWQRAVSRRPTSRPTTRPVASRPASVSSRPAGVSTRPARATRRVHVFISGRVQGVGFRAFTLRNARALKLTGWVRNLRDRRVEAVIEGPAEKVALLLERVNHGPSRARVDKVEVKDEAPAGDFKTFVIESTR